MVIPPTGVAGGRAMSDAGPGFALHLVDGETAVTHFRPVGERPT